MGMVVFIIFSLWIIWVVVAFIVNLIRESIEDKIIKKYKVKEIIENDAAAFNEAIDTQISTLRTEISSIQEMSMKQLPGLKDRIERDSRRVDYIKNHRPLNSYNKRRRI